MNVVQEGKQMDDLEAGNIPDEKPQAAQLEGGSDRSVEEKK
jgi:hypothetical protein